MNSVPALPFHIRHLTAFAIMFGALMLSLAITFGRSGQDPARGAVPREKRTAKTLSRVVVGSWELSVGI